MVSPQHVMDSGPSMPFFYKVLGLDPPITQIKV